MDNRFLCRGKCTDNGEWVYGYYLKSDNANLIIARSVKSEVLPDEYEILSLYGDFYEVDSSTVGRCTGLSAAKSCRGTEPEDLLVYEGDVIRGRNEYEISDVVCRDGVWMMSQFLGHKPALWEIPPIEIIGTIYDKTEGEG